MDVGTCPFCNLPLDTEDTVTIRDKGAAGINAAAKQRNDSLIVTSGQVVHTSCRRDYTSKKTITSHPRQKLDNESRQLRREDKFSFKDQCFFCCEHVELDKKETEIEVCKVTTLMLQNTIKNTCRERNDMWAQNVLTRVESVHDLPAADAIYHKQCSVNFRTGRNIPQGRDTPTSRRDTPTSGRDTPTSGRDTPTGVKRRAGRPIHEATEQAFLDTMNYLQEKEDEQLTIQDLVLQMEKLCGEHAYSAFHMKNRIKDYFGDEIIIAEVNGRHNVISLRQTASSILLEFHERESSQDQDSEKRNIIKTAASLIRADIKSMQCNKETYPLSSNIESLEDNSDFVPASLKHLLSGIMREKDTSQKVSSIGQCIMQATRPRSIIAPLQIGLAVQMHHHFASKFLNDTLNHLGFASSYSEVQRYEACAAASAVRVADNVSLGKDEFMQYVADNVDHNVRTLDGHGTFHGMGILAGTTPAVIREQAIKRTHVSCETLIDLSKIDISYYKPRISTSSPLMFNPLKPVEVTDISRPISLLSSLTWPRLTMGWSSMCQMIANGVFPDKSSFEFLPMIDLNPSDLTCIYSTLNFICKEAKKYNVDPVVTFDQPLYWKAMNMIHQEDADSILKSVVVRLGGFHTEMSFLGTIGHIMNNSGLAEALETIYAPNAVSHMLSGKAISRAIRGHSIVYNALNIIIMNEICDSASVFRSYLSEADKEEHNGRNSEKHIPDLTITPDSLSDNINASEENESSTLSQESTTTANERHGFDIEAAIEDLCRKVEGQSSLDDMSKDEKLLTVSKLVDEFRDSLKDCRTSKLWFQYMDMMEILRKFITAERTGDWNLHKKSLSEMLPFMAAAGHNLYVKSSHIYLQQMQDLPVNHPQVEQFFQAGYHVLRRSRRYWAGLSPDLVIEQVLMRSIKTTGGLTRGRGITPSQRSQWLLSMPQCALINNAMQQFTSIHYGTSEQHKELGTTRKKRDDADTLTCLGFLKERSPFVNDIPLRNIETGVSGDKTVNAEKALTMGQEIVNDMVGKKVSEYVFKRNRQVTTLASKGNIKIDGDEINVDPQLLFQRLLAAANGETNDLSELFNYELTSSPSSIFDNSGLMRLADKSALTDVIWKLGDCASTTGIEMHTDCVLDGGSLLHRLPWTKGDTFLGICGNYIKYVMNRYADPIIVFDGYNSTPSTKDHAHRRRSKGIVGSQVRFGEMTPFRSKKDIFLSNEENKENFIRLLSREFNKRGIRTLHSSHDADVLIVKTAIENSRQRPTTVIGEDTDLLVLLLFHANPNSEITFRSDKITRGQNETRVWDIRKTIAVLGEENRQHLPVAHAMTGCDTTSRLHGIGKGTAVSKMISSQYIKEKTSVFMASDPPKEDIIKAGEDILVKLYGGAELENLNILRYRRWAQKVMSNTFATLQVQSLPPTSDAASHHCLRVFYQVKEWINDNEDIQPIDFGWHLVDGKMEPVKTSLPVAPEKLLNIIRCRCKTNCDTKRCTCRKHGLLCSLACTECRGATCSNPQNANDVDIDDASVE